MFKIVAVVAGALLLTASAQAHPWGWGPPGWGWHHHWHGMGGYDGPDAWGGPYVEPPVRCQEERVWRHHHWVVVCAEE
jgi:hypothetical protein